MRAAGDTKRGTKGDAKPGDAARRRRAPDAARCVRAPDGQEGGAAILAALSLLALLTVAALGMSRSSFKEIRTSGFLRQGAMARNVADSGLHWSIYWLDMPESGDAAAQRLIALKNAIAGDNGKSGRLWGVDAAEYRPGGPPSAGGASLPPPSSGPDFRPGTDADYEQGFTIGLMRMGKLPVTNMSQGAGQGAFAPAAGGAMPQAPDLWAIRSDAQIRPAGPGTTFAHAFTHAKEAWVSTPAR